MQTLTARYSQQRAVGDKHRAKGRQTITVKYVNVEAGGQMIVGNVESQSRAGGTADQPIPLKAVGRMTAYMP